MLLASPSFMPQNVKFLPSRKRGIPLAAGCVCHPVSATGSQEMAEKDVNALKEGSNQGEKSFSKTSLARLKLREPTEGFCSKAEIPKCCC